MCRGRVKIGNGIAAKRVRVEGEEERWTLKGGTVISAKIVRVEGAEER